MPFYFFFLEETTVTESVTTIDPEEEQPRNISSDWALVGKTVRVLGWGVIDDGR